MCPQYHDFDFESWRLPIRSMRDFFFEIAHLLSPCNEEFMQKDPNEALELLDEIVEKANQLIVPLIALCLSHVLINKCKLQ